jgi:protein tyrosine phosphatase (PTP) superfamily phosphohydrolase (DUF442 family)
MDLLAYCQTGPRTTNLALVLKLKVERRLKRLE